jgi:hypothetical protein
VAIECGRIIDDGSGAGQKEHWHWAACRKKQ